MCQPGCAAALLYRLIDESTDRCIRYGADLKDRAVRPHHPRNDLRDCAIDIASWQRAFFDERSDSLREILIATHINQARLNDWITGRRNNAISTEHNVRFKNVIIA